MAQRDQGLRRRALLLALDLKPADLRAATGAHPVKVSRLLNGRGRLRPEEGCVCVFNESRFRLGQSA